MRRLHEDEQGDRTPDAAWLPHSSRNPWRRFRSGRSDCLAFPWRGVRAAPGDCRSGRLALRGAPVELDRAGTGLVVVVSRRGERDGEPVAMLVATSERPER